MIMNKAYVPKAVDRVSSWRLVDADGKTVGRLATEIAIILRGKDKPTFTPSADMGDYVVVVNAEKVEFSGDKWDQKIYTRHSGFTGGRKETLAKDVLKRFPERIVEKAVAGMLPKGPLGRKLRTKLKVYVGKEHPHQVQFAVKSAK